jgi:uncharacterized membrane protein
VLLFGESLGSYGTELAFDGLDDIRSQVHDALLVGPTFANPRPGHNWPMIAKRAPRSGYRSSRHQPARTLRARPTISKASPRTVSNRASFTSRTRPIRSRGGASSSRIKPDWAGVPAAPDRAPAFHWFPIVTFWQVGMDLADSLNVPAGHGHYFGSNVVNGWVAVSKPDGWSEEATQRLREIVESLEEWCALSSLAI